MTDLLPSDGQRARPADPEASLRQNLAAQLASAQADLDARLDDLRRSASDGGLIAQGQSQREHLGALQRRLERSGGASLTAIHAEIVSCIAAVQAVVQQAGSAAAKAQTAEAALHAASAAARSEVTSFVHDFYERKIFDPYLRFASPEDEQEYRRRETERQRAIEKALAEDTPEGNLRANQLAAAQLKDAGKHGADRSPDYQPMLDRLNSAGSGLGAQMTVAQAAGKPEPVADPLSGLGTTTQLPADLIRGFQMTRIALAETGEGHGLAARNTPPTKETGRV